MVVTVHDMIHDRLPHYFINGSKISDNKREVVERADKIIAISKHTKGGLCRTPSFEVLVNKF